jgi:hypothetical protein
MKGDVQGSSMRYLILISAIILLNISGLSAMKTDDGFSIFLPKDDISRENILNTDLKKLLLRDDPIISERDIIYYYKMEHSIRLSNNSIDKLRKLKDGTVVIICLGRKPIYWAIIWSGIYSVALDGVFLMKPDPWDEKRCIVQIQCGYPTEECFTGKDPRNSPEIFASLKRAGKLIE